MSIIKISKKSIVSLYQNAKPQTQLRKNYDESYKCQNKSVNKFQDKNVQKIYNIDILKKRRYL